MVVTVNGIVADNHPEPILRTWFGPGLAFLLFAGINYWLFRNGHGLSLLQLAVLEGVGATLVIVPVTRMVRNVDVEKTGIEVRLWRGGYRFFRWDEIETVKPRRRGGRVTRITVEDVYGRRLYLRSVRGLDRLLDVLQHCVGMAAIS